MVGTRKPMADPLMRRKDDKGYIVAWKYKYKFETGKVDSEPLTWGEAGERAAKLMADDPEKVAWAEMVFEDE